MTNTATTTVNQTVTPWGLGKLEKSGYAGDSSMKDFRLIDGKLVMSVSRIGSFSVKTTWYLVGSDDKIIEKKTCFEDN
jgi:hypothetical protein